MIAYVEYSYMPDRWWHQTLDPNLVGSGTNELGDKGKNETTCDRSALTELYACETTCDRSPLYFMHAQATLYHAKCCNSS